MLLTEQLKELEIAYECKNISELSPEVFIEQNNFIFIISTHFDGNSCFDGLSFYSWIQTEQDKEGLAGKRFTLFGLGDQTFPNFNLCSRTYFKHFKLCKMHEFFPFETGSDHNGNIEMDFLPWMEGLVKFLKSSTLLQQTPPTQKLFVKGLHVELKALSDVQAAQLREAHQICSFHYQKYEKTRQARVESIDKCYQEEFEGNQTYRIELTLEE